MKEYSCPKCNSTDLLSENPEITLDCTAEIVEHGLNGLERKRFRWLNVF
jgi:hypothetical protein